MQGVFLDTSTLGEGLDFSALEACLPGWQFFPLTRAGETGARIANAEVILTNKVVLDAPLLAGAAKLKLVCVTATGTNNVDLEAASKLGVAVCNVRDYAGASVSQHVLALLLGLATQWQRYDRDVREGAWSRADSFCLMHHPITELAGKTFGIIGYGALGKAVAHAVSALGMQVLVAQGHDGDSEGRVPLPELLARSDVVSLHCPLTDQTNKMVNESFLAAMKSTAFLINTARGGLVDELALKAALAGGEIAGAAVDVLGAEPPSADHPLLVDQPPNLLITPHCAWISLEARQRMLDQVVDIVTGWRRGTLINCVNGLESV